MLSSRVIVLMLPVAVFFLLDRRLFMRSGLRADEQFGINSLHRSIQVEAMNRLLKINELLNVSLMGLGGVCLVLMTGICCANMVMRLLGTPLSAAYELVAFSGAVTVALPLGYTQLKKSHIAVDILSATFSDRLHNVVVQISMVLSTVFFSLAAWKTAQHAAKLQMSGELSETTRMPFYPFTYAVAFSCGVMALCLVLDLIALNTTRKEAKQ